MPLLLLTRKNTGQIGRKPTLISVSRLNLCITKQKQFDLHIRSYVSYFRSYISQAPVPSSVSFNDHEILSVYYNLLRIIWPFALTNVIPKGTFGLWCTHRAQLITHAAFAHLPLTLQLCYKAFWHIAEGN